MSSLISGSTVTEVCDILVDVRLKITQKQSRILDFVQQLSKATD